MSASTAFSARAPRAGTTTFVSLQALHALEGQASEIEWRGATQRRIRCQVAQWDVCVQSLISAGMVFQRNDLFILSDDGLSWLGVSANVVPRAQPKDVPSRYVPPQRPLSRGNMPRMQLMRPGALDFLEIPSRVGNDLIPHRKA